MPMTIKEADKVIKSGEPVDVTTRNGDLFKLTILSRDRRYLRGMYEWNGKTHSGTFARSDITLASLSHPL